MKRGTHIGAWLVVVGMVMFLLACAANNDGASEQSTGGQNEVSNGTNEDVGDGDAGAESESATRIIEHEMGETEVPADPQRVVVLTGDALEALLSVGVQPVGSAEAMGEEEWYPHLEDEMDGVVNVGGMSEPDLEAIHSLEPDLILGTRSRQEDSYELLSAIAPTIFTETHTLGNWKDDFRLYVDAIGKAEEGAEVLAAWEERAAELSARLDEAGQLDHEVGVVRFTAGQGRYFYNNSYSGSILIELGFARPERHDDDEEWIENITQERIPEMDADVLLYFVLDEGDGEAYEFADEWMETPLFDNLRAAQNDRIYEVADDYWNMTYGIISADYVLDDVERIFLGETE